MHLNKSFMLLQNPDYYLLQQVKIVKIHPWFEERALPLAADVVRGRSAASCGWYGLKEERCLLGLVWVEEGAIPLAVGLV